jgi:hypothetical protein
MALPTHTYYTTRINSAEIALRTAYDKANNPNVFYTDPERALRTERALPALQEAEQTALQAVEAALSLSADVIRDTEQATPVLSPQTV